jgi:hypothetical protein
MAKNNNNLSQLRRQKLVVRNEIRRMLQVILRRMPCGLMVVTSPRTKKRSARNNFRFEVAGNVTRSIILAWPGINFGGLKTKLAGGLVIVITVVTVFSGLSPSGTKNTLQPFAQGDPYKLNVVVAPYRLAGTTDQACEWFATNLANRIAEKLNRAAPSDTAVWLPQQINADLTQQLQNETKIEAFARERKVDLVLMGDVVCDKQEAIIRPSVFAAPSFFAGTPEMNGFYNFDDVAQQVNVRLNNSALEQNAAQQSVRATALIDIGRGFRQKAADTQEDMKKASALFMQLAQSGSLADRRGQSMLWYMSGQSLLAQAMDECNKLDAQRLNEAENSFQMSLQHEPELAMAFVSLGNISLYRMQLQQDDRGNQLQRLSDTSLARFARAQQALVQPANGLAVALAAMGEAQARIARYDTDPASTAGKAMLERAIDGLYEVIQWADANTGSGREAQSIAARAYALLGDVQHAQLQDEWALSSYSKASWLSPDRRLKTSVALSLAELYTARGDACSAAEQFQVAAETPCELDKRNFAFQAREMQYFCQQKNDMNRR